MFAKHLSLTDYRCYEKAEIPLVPGINVIRGPNAAGKTNLLESFLFFSTLKPLRSVKDKDLIRSGADYAFAELEFESEGRDKKIEIALSQTGGRKITKNGVAIRKNTEVIGSFTTVIFSPDDLYLVKGAASERRKLCDRAICQLRPSYYSALANYNSVLIQKQKLLKQLDEKPSLIDTIPSFNQSLAEYGTRIIVLRNSYIRKLSETANAFALSLSDGKDDLTLSYKTLSNIPDSGAESEQIRECFTEHLKNHYSAELASRTCLSGPHRDDMEICINGTSARSFASQGQTRTAAIAIKLAEREIFYRETGEYPVLLLDDVLSELDETRQSGVLNKTGNGQVILTCCSMESVPKHGRIFTIDSGRVTGVSDTSD